MTEDRVEMFISARKFTTDKVTNIVNAMADIGYMLIYSGPGEGVEGDPLRSKLIFQKIIEEKL